MPTFKGACLAHFAAGIPTADFFPRTVVILLVERGVTLPSNLQGLYRCDFEGDRLEYESTMKLLKTFSQFR